MTQVCLAVFIEVPDQDILNMFGWRKNDFINKTHLILSRSTQSSYFVAAVLFAASPEKYSDIILLRNIRTIFSWEIFGQWQMDIAF